METGTLINEAFSGYNSYFIYKVGEMVKVDDYNKDINVICAQGIHYFLTKEAAEFYEIGSRKIKNRLFCQWNDNGCLISSCNHNKNGERHGLYQEWYYNSDQLYKQCTYKTDSKMV